MRIITPPKNTNNKRKKNQEILILKIKILILIHMNIKIKLKKIGWDINIIICKKSIIKKKKSYYSIWII